MGALVLDTTVLIDALRGRPAAERIRDLVSRREVLLTTAINVEEIVRGLRPSEHAAADALFTALRVLPIREADARRAGAWRREHAARGVTLHQADCLIGAVTAGIDCRLPETNRSQRRTTVQCRVPSS
ncbi:MAG: PIN domain-containing protein [Pseudonocardiaceae bacterium]